MTIQGAIYELNNMLFSNDIPCYWKPVIKKIIETVEQTEQNVGMCQKNVGEMSEKQTDRNLISRQSVITMLQKIENAVEDGDGFQFNEWIEYAKDIPSAEKTAEWIRGQVGIHTTEYKCSACGRTVRDDTGYDVVADYPYCHCGARMKEH